MSPETLTAQERIRRFEKYGSKLGLERMRALLACLGNPERALRAIHVAGTNGKGSVSRYLYECLCAAGYTAGVYTSPFIVDFRERIEANGSPIPERELEALTDQTIAAADTLISQGMDSPTEFEIITAIGMLYFAALRLDFVVLEVGLGGRGDSTNVVERPAVCVITPVSFDHMDRLGATIEAIAGEKAGIIKPGCPVVSAAGQEFPEAAKVVARQAYALGAPLIDASRIRPKVHESGLWGSRFSCVIGGRRYDNIEISMAGAHQVDNAITALATLELLRARGLIRGDGEALRAGMKKARMPARFEVETIKDTPFIFDGAHNLSGALALVRTLLSLCPGRRILFVLSILRDKAAEEMLGVFTELQPAPRFIAAASTNARCLPAAELAARIEEAGGAVVASATDAAQALMIAGTLADETGAELVVCAGSLYMVGEMLQALRAGEDNR